MTDTTTEPAILPRSPVVRPLVIAAVGVVAVGLLTRRRDLVRGGLRLGAVQLATSAIEAVVHRSDKHGGDGAAPPPLVAAAMATWLADTLVTMAFDRLDPPAAPVVDHEPRRGRSADG